jgi:hypothetical protein
MTEQLRNSGQPGLAHYVTRAADEIDHWSSRLRNQDLDDALREVEQFARRKPVVFLGVAFGVGLLAARFLKSSSQAGSRGQDENLNQWRSTSSSLGARQQPSIAHDAPEAGPATPSGNEML